MNVRGSFAHPALHRVLQFRGALFARQDDAVDMRLRQLLRDEQHWSNLARLAPYDRAHHLHVHDRLLERWPQSEDLLRAALLHDIGKADARGRVWLAHRVVVVILRKVSPGSLARLNRHDLPGPLHGFYLASHHAALGAELARAAGCSTRTCELIAHHERHGPVDDPELAALIEADERTAG